MNMDMYNQVKEALRNGRSLDDIVKDISAMAAAAEQELKPKTPIADYCRDPQVINEAIEAIDDLHCGSIDPIATLVAAWFVENGVTPDKVFKSHTEFMDKVYDQLIRDLQTFKAVCEFAKTQKGGAFDSQLIKMFI